MKLLLLVFRIKLSWKRIRQVLSKNALLSIQLQTLIFADPSKIKAIGNPTEGALLLWLHKAGVN